MHTVGYDGSQRCSDPPGGCGWLGPVAGLGVGVGWEATGAGKGAWVGVGWDATEAGAGEGAWVGVGWEATGAGAQRPTWELLASLSAATKAWLQATSGG